MEMKQTEDSTSVLEQNAEVGSGDIQQKVDQQPVKLEFKMNMDEAMEQLDVPFKKVKKMENTYLLSLNTKEQIEETVLKLQALTKVTWSVKQTRKFVPCVKKRPKKPITVFKRQYGCHMSTRTRLRTKRLRNKKSRNINCPAQLMVFIKAYASSAKAKPKLHMFDKDFPCIFEFRRHHNHLVDVADVLTTRPMSDDLKDAICKLLSKGHSCASAYHTLYTIKVEEFGGNYKTKMADRYNFPKRNDISSIYKSHRFRENYERFLEVAYVAKNLEDMLLQYQKKNGTLYRMSVKDDNMIVICLCTPLMQRALQQVSEVLFIDASSDDFKEYKLYFILSQSPAGALPISCILSNKKDVAAFREGMKLFREMIDIQPAIVLSNNAIITELIAQKFFPDSKVMFSFYHALNSAWRALYETRHELARAKKESYYQLFREVVFADSEEGLVVARQVLAVECAQPKFLKFIDKMYENIPLWSLYYRQFLVHDSSESFNYNEGELSFRLFRLISKIALDRTRLFNLNQLTDFMCSAFEKYYKSRILEIVLGKKSEVLEERYGRVGSNTPCMEDIGHHQYLFKKNVPDVLDEYYQVDMITHLCTCGMGAVGKHCDHIAQILATSNVFSPTLTLDQKAAAYFIATGVLKSNNSFLPDQDQSSMEHEGLSPSPETILGTEYPEMSEGNNKHIRDEVPPNLEATKTKWISYCNKILKLMEKDPIQFVPAVNVHLDNIKEHSVSVPRLLKGLYAGFPYVGDSVSLPPLPPLAIISNKTSTGSASVHSQVPGLINMKEESKISIEVNPLTSINQDAKRFRLDLEEDCKNNIRLAESLVQETSKVNFPDTVTLNQLPGLNGKTISFGVDPEHSSDNAESDQEEFEFEKGIFVHQAALNQLTHDEVAVLDEKKGILIIPMPGD